MEHASTKYVIVRSLMTALIAVKIAEKSLDRTRARWRVTAAMLHAVKRIEYFRRKEK